MAELQPFCGYRFKLKHPAELERFIAPPYDMLTREMIDDLYNKDEHNIVRVTQNRPQGSDTSNSQRHVRAAAELSSWIDLGVLKQDDDPSIYVYDQKFMNNDGSGIKEVVRTGVVVLVKLVDFEDKVVLPHEATLTGPKKDRYELLDACRTHTEQIFGLLDDDGRFYSLLRSLVGKNPDGQFTDINGVVHSLYRCNDKKAIDALVGLARDRTVLIADGHHRYETALNFYRDNPDPAYAFTMMTLVSTADPGLLIRPFHRLVRQTGRSIDMHDELSRYFVLKDLGDIDEKTIFRFTGAGDSSDFLFLDNMRRRMFACDLNENGKQRLESIFPEKSTTWKHLPVSIINAIVINTILALPLDGHVLHDVIEYVNDIPSGAARCMDKNEFYGGFFIRPSTIDTVGRIVASGERMPQKSTNFFPKMYSGLVLHKMNGR